MKKSIAFLVILMITISTIAMAANFSDLVPGHWAEEYITDLADKGVINGYLDGTYKPDDMLTYGAFIKLIVTASLPDSDLSILNPEYDHWAAPHLTVLENYNIVEKGTITKEMLDGPISRIEVVRIMTECDIKIRENSQKTASISFTDIGDMSDANRTALRHAVACEVISGDPTGTFRPNDTLIRSEAAKIVFMYAK